MKSHPAHTIGAAALCTLIGAVILTGCATTDCVGPTGNPRLTPAQVGATQGHTGERLRWGGALGATRNLKDSTELEIIGYPLDRCGVPRVGQQPIGRFIVVAPGFLEPADYRPDRLVTATGMITDIRDGMVGTAPYRFPVLANAKVTLWPETVRDGDGSGTPRPWVSIGIGGGSGGWYGGGIGGGVGVQF
ncbi:Slp family lipoprotein [Lamprocystis purpurea]|jgi:outer membrane lipoprotein|uniref:Slp family lipoprotein n=1 Tax=Lamprocystis purpurea TaxID=61598 RepID=UPI000372668B|nr:Slp family lipoprotein [Lamprocystis purpurea]MBV5347831.1 Slp family lipoprotein [bacterium]